jgi:regulator of G-protein signaling
LSKVAESYCTFYEQWAEYDPFITLPEPSNPWVTDSTDFWELERQTRDVPCRRVRRWAFSVKELLRDPAGREQFYKFLEKEFSAENLK